MGGLDPPTSYKEQEKNETNEQKDYPAGAGRVLCGSADAGGMWQLVRNNAAQVEECRAFALWTIDKKAMDEQIAFNLQKSSTTTRRFLRPPGLSI